MEISVLFVCLGNICRSPMAEALFRHKVQAAGLEDLIHIDSAGTGDWHVGSRPHEGTLAILHRHDIASDGIVARQLSITDLMTNDYIIVMDASNLRAVEQMAADQHTKSTATIARLLDYADPAIAGDAWDVPDPYFGGGFDHVYRLIDSGCTGLLAEIRQK